jgi:hypothetical protein
MTFAELTSHPFFFPLALTFVYSLVVMIVWRVLWHTERGKRHMEGLNPEYNVKQRKARGVPARMPFSHHL